MGIAILLFLVFSGIESAPGTGYNGTYVRLSVYSSNASTNVLPKPADGEVHTYAFPLPGTNFVACMNAVLNITFLWVPQILFPTL